MSEKDQKKTGVQNQQYQQQNKVNFSQKNFQSHNQDDEDQDKKSKRGKRVRRTQNAVNKANDGVNKLNSTANKISHIPFIGFTRVGKIAKFALSPLGKVTKVLGFLHKGTTGVVGFALRIFGFSSSLGKKKKAATVVLGVIGFIVVIGIGAYLFAPRPDLDGGTTCLYQNNGDNSYSDLDTASIPADQDWTKKGTERYKNAKKLFMFCVKKLGFSGAGAAGVVANARRESNFDPKAYNPSGGVRGLLQWGDGSGPNGDRFHKGGFMKSEEDYNMENSLKLMEYELVHSFQTVAMQMAYQKDPQEAAILWLHDYEIGAGQAEDERKKYAVKAYEMFGGDKYDTNPMILANKFEKVSDTADSNSAVAEKANDDKCQPTSSAVNTDDLLEMAKDLIGYFSYKQVRPIDKHTSKHGKLESFSDVDKNGETDCSGFIWVVMKLTDHKVPEGGWMTGTMEDDARGDQKYLKKIDPKDAKAGDILIANTTGTGNGGHTCIFVNDPNAKSTSEIMKSDTKIIELGGGKQSVSYGKVNTSFGDLGKGSVTVARPVK